MLLAPRDEDANLRTGALALRDVKKSVRKDERTNKCVISLMKTEAGVEQMSPEFCQGQKSAQSRVF